MLRRREPDAARPYRAFGFPATTIIVLIGCFALWLATILDDPRSAIYAAALLACCAPLYAWLKRREMKAVRAGL